MKRKDRSNLGRGWGDAERERKRGSERRLERELVCQALSQREPQQNLGPAA